MKKISILCLLLTSISCWSGEDGNYLIKQTEKRKPKVTVQHCYEAMVSEMVWSSQVVTRAGQNQTILLSYIDNSLLEKANPKLLQRIAQEEQEYSAILEQFDQAQKKHRAFHEQIQRELQATKT